MRDSFRKELNMQKNTTSGQGRQKRRKYVYFEQLLFLLPTIHERKTSGNYSPPQENNADDDGDQNDTPEIIEQQKRVYEGYRIEKPNKKPCRPKTTSYEEELLQILKENRREEIDEDKTFLLSLLPSFKIFSPQQKLTAKMEFLQVIQWIMFQCNNESTAISHQVNQQFQMNPYSFPGRSFTYTTLCRQMQPQIHQIVPHPAQNSFGLPEKTVLPQIPAHSIGKYLPSYEPDIDSNECSTPISSIKSSTGSSSASTSLTEL